MSMIPQTSSAKGFPNGGYYYETLQEAFHSYGEGQASFADLQTKIKRDVNDIATTANSFMQLQDPESLGVFQKFLHGEYEQHNTLLKRQVVVATTIQVLEKTIQKCTEESGSFNQHHVDRLTKFGHNMSELADQEVALVCLTDRLDGLRETLTKLDQAVRTYISAYQIALNPAARYEKTTSRKWSKIDVVPTRFLRADSYFLQQFGTYQSGLTTSLPPKESSSSSDKANEQKRSFDWAPFPPEYTQPFADSQNGMEGIQLQIDAIPRLTQRFVATRSVLGLEQFLKKGTAHYETLTKANATAKLAMAETQRQQPTTSQNDQQQFSSISATLVKNDQSLQQMLAHLEQAKIGLAVLKGEQPGYFATVWNMWGGSSANATLPRPRTQSDTTSISSPPPTDQKTAPAQDESQAAVVAAAQSSPSQAASASPRAVAASSTSPSKPSFAEVAASKEAVSAPPSPKKGAKELEVEIAVYHTQPITQASEPIRENPESDATSGEKKTGTLPQAKQVVKKTRTATGAAAQAANGM